MCEQRCEGCSVATGRARGLQSRQEGPPRAYEAVWPVLQTFLKRCGPPCDPCSNAAPKWPRVPFAALWGCTRGFDSRAWFSRGWTVPVPIMATRKLRADRLMGGGAAGDGERTPGDMRVAVPPSHAPAPGSAPCSCTGQSCQCAERSRHMPPPVLRASVRPSSKLPFVQPRWSGLSLQGADGCSLGSQAAWSKSQLICALPVGPCARHLMSVPQFPWL